MKKQLFISIVILLILIGATAIVGIYGRGYEINIRSGKPEITGTGLLVLTSNPDGAQVYVNDKLTTATNNTINLPPGSYKIKISKQGYFDWKKTLNIQKEIVAKADALLFPVSPKYESITDTGIYQAVLDPTGTKIAFSVASDSAKKNGIFIFTMKTTPILDLQGATQIIDDQADIFSTAKLMWSLDGQKLLASTSASTYLLDTNGFNNNLQNIKDQIPTILNTWLIQKDTAKKAQIASLFPILQTTVTNSFNIISWSPDENKILYTPNVKYTIPTVINPPLIGVNSTPEMRTILPGNIYVYDLKEDRNYYIVNWKLEIGNSQSIRWMPDSKHILIVQNKQIFIKDFDGQNKIIISGPFADDNNAFPWPDGSKIVFRTNLGNPDSTPNLYTVGLR